MYSVKDCPAGEFGPIYLAKNHQVANRQFIGILKNIPEVNKNDYKLYYLGLYDSEYGITDIPVEPTLVEGFETAAPMNIQLEDIR